MFKIESFDAFGRVAFSAKTEDEPSYWATGAYKVLDKVIHFPSTIIEDQSPNGFISERGDLFPKIIDLYSLDGKIIRTFHSNYNVTFRDRIVWFIDCNTRHFVRLFGYYIVREDYSEVSISEYAKLRGLKIPYVRKMCKKGRILEAEIRGRQWSIPKACGIRE